MKRREFLKSSATLVAAAGTTGLSRAAESLQIPDNQSEAAADGSLIISHPILQNYAETSMGIAFAVSALANGYVLIGHREDLSDARKIKCGGYRVTDLEDRIMRIRVTGLKPATTYYYRIGADRIQYIHGSKMKVLGTEEDPRTYRFTTAGAKARAAFCVMNDTHSQWTPLGLALDKIASLPQAPSCVIWNGDVSANRDETVESQVGVYFRPQVARKDYASETPFLLCPGNHDSRGMANRHLERAWMFRQPEERSPRDWDLGRNFAVRMGEIALIGLDTAEDKLDSNPRYAGLFASEPYREAQTQWLRDALRRKDIAQAPYIVAFCHIPLYDDNPTNNPGDCAPDDTDPRYTTDYALWQRTCGRMWGPLLQKAGCQLVITGHQHRYRYLAPNSDHSWAEIIGGGPEMKPADRFPTLIEGSVEKGVLTVRVHNLRDNSIQDSFSFKPRSVKSSSAQ